MDPLTGLELAKPAIKTACDMYQTSREKRQFEGFLAGALQLSSLDAEASERSAKFIMGKLDDVRKQEYRGRLRRPRWWARTNRGPGVERLNTRTFSGLLDDWYAESIDAPGDGAGSAGGRAAVSGRAAANGRTAIISDKFIGVVVDKASSMGPDCSYAQSLLDAFGRNDARFAHWQRWSSAAGGLAATSTAAVLVTGVHGAVDVDLKTALVILVGLLITLGITAVSGAVDSLTRARYPAPARQDAAGPGAGIAPTGP